VDGAGNVDATSFVSARHATDGGASELWNGLNDGNFRLRMQVDNAGLLSNDDCTLTDAGWTGASCPFGTQWFALMSRSGALTGTSAINADVWAPFKIKYFNAMSSSSANSGITIEALPICVGGTNEDAVCPNGNAQCTGGGTCTGDAGMFRFAYAGTYLWDMGFGWRNTDATIEGQYKACNASSTNSGQTCILDTDCPGAGGACSDTAGIRACLKYLGYIEPNSAGTGSVDLDSEAVLAPAGQDDSVTSQVVNHAALSSGVLTVTTPPLDFYFYADDCHPANYRCVGGPNAGNQCTSDTNCIDPNNPPPSPLSGTCESDGGDEFDHEIVHRSTRIRWLKVAD